MSRLTLPATLETALAAARPQLGAVQQRLGRVPKLFRLVAQAVAA